MVQYNIPKVVWSSQIHRYGVDVCYFGGRISRQWWYQMECGSVSRQLIARKALR